MKNKNRPLTASQRKAKERKLKRDRGLIPLEIWIHKTQKENVKEMIKKFKNPLRD